jgi:hypothetical protein
MRKILTGLVAAAAIGTAAIATSGTAEARWWGPGPFVAGAVVGGAFAAAAAAPYYYGPGPYGYYYRPYAYSYYGPGCGRVWNGYYWVRACY